MKKTIIMLITLLTAALLLIAGCADAADEPAASPTSAPITTPTPTPEPEPALAICMSAIDHPIHRQVQLGFIDGCKALGYEDVSVIGTEGFDQEAQLDMALEWAKSVEGRPAALLLWNGDHNSDEWCEKLGEMGVYVGIPHFMIFVDDDYSAIDEYRISGDIKTLDKVSLPEGISFEYRIDDYQAGRYAAEYMAKKLDGKEGSVICSILTKATSTNEHAEGFEQRLKELKIEGKYDLSGITVQDCCMLGGDTQAQTETAKGYYEYYDNLIGVFGISHSAAVPWTTAFREEGVDPDDWVMVTYDVLESSVGLLENGEVDLFIGQSLYYEGYKCAENFDKLFKGEEVPKFEYIDAEYLNEDTADELLPKYKELFERVKDEEFFEKYKAKSFIGG